MRMSLDRVIHSRSRVVSRRKVTRVRDVGEGRSRDGVEVRTDHGGTGVSGALVPGDRAGRLPLPFQPLHLLLRAPHLALRPSQLLIQHPQQLTLLRQLLMNRKPQLALTPDDRAQVGEGGAILMLSLENNFFLSEHWVKMLGEV